MKKLGEQHQPALAARLFDLPAEHRRRGFAAKFVFQAFGRQFGWQNAQPVQQALGRALGICLADGVQMTKGSLGVPYTRCVEAEEIRVWHSWLKMS